AREPGNARAWRTLATVQQKLGHADAAIDAWRRALEVDPTNPAPLFGLGVAHAARGEVDRALEWLGKAKATGRVDMTQMEVAPPLAALRQDPRYAALLPTARDFQHPFVEPTAVLREWDGESAGDQFGWIARNIGDVD